MSRGLGTRQRFFLSAIRDLETVHGAGRWFYVHATVRAAWPGADPATDRPMLRPGPDVEGALNPSRILATLARRGLIERNPRRGLGASIRLTPKGRSCSPTA